MEKVFVYGTLKEGFGNHVLLKDSVMLGNYTTPPNYTMISLGAFPGIILRGHTPIIGEVYEVDNDVFGRLDRLEGYPSFYNRIQIPTDFGEAWMYHLGLTHNGRVVETGEWLPRRDFHRMV